MNIVAKISKRYHRKHGTYPTWEQMAATATKGEILHLLLYYDAIREAHETIIHTTTRTKADNRL